MKSATYHGGAPIGGGIGQQGPAGPAGPAGAAGATGAPGSVWYNGPGLADPGLGINGDYYLNTLFGDVYYKSGGTWAFIESIKGPTGATGATGAAGAAGALWYSGAGAPAGALGAVNDFYLNSSNGDYYKKTATNTWTLQGNLKGPTGATGATGATGPAGPAGPGSAAISISPYAFSSTASGGFTNRLLCIKILCPSAATVTRMYSFLFNTYGGLQIRMGIYSLDGNTLLGSTLKTTISASLHQYYSLPLQASVNLSANTEYWLAFWGNGIDVPAGTMFANLNPGTFPGGVHCCENPSVTDLPATISVSNPMQAATVIIPIGAY